MSQRFNFIIASVTFNVSQFAHELPPLLLLFLGNMNYESTIQFYYRFGNI